MISTNTSYHPSRFTLPFILVIIINITLPAYSVDIYSYLNQADKPLSLGKPSWIDEKPKIQLSYEVNEVYKKWLDKNKVTDFEGTGFNASLQINPAKHFAFGFSKKFLNHQSWINNEKKDMPVFNFDSKNHYSEAFIKLGSERFKLMCGHIETEDNFNGYYELHEDIINALGSEPEIKFNTDGTSDYLKVYAEHKKFKFAYSYELNKYKHKINADTDIMGLCISHNRKVRIRDYEISYDLNKKWFPYIRYSDYRDTGFGNDYRDNRVLIGRNNSYFKFVTRTIGTVYEYKHGWYYADYSKVFADMSADEFFNMVNIDVLFYFSTRFVDYRTSFKPERGHMGRIGFKRHHRNINYGMQYSLAKLHGVTNKFGEKTKFNGSTTEVKSVNRALYLHRMNIAASRPDNFGSWNIGLNILVPYFKSYKPEIIGAIDNPAAAKPKKKYRGGWQIVLMREIKL